MNIISKLLEKRGVKPEELSSEEKATLKTWELTLSKGEITVPSISAFCEANIMQIESQFKDLENSKNKIERLVLLHSVYKSMLGIINSPKHEKENLENYLQSLL